MHVACNVVDVMKFCNTIGEIRPISLFCNGTTIQSTTVVWIVLRLVSFMPQGKFSSDYDFFYVYRYHVCFVSASW